MQKSLGSLEHLSFPRGPSQQTHFPRRQEQDGSLALNFLFFRNHWNMNRILIKPGSCRGQGHTNCLQSSGKQTAFLLIPHLPILIQWPAQAEATELSCRGVTAFGKFWTIPSFPGGANEHHGKNFSLEHFSYGFEE